MSWEHLMMAVAVGSALVATLCVWTVLRLRGREPYASFLRLPNRRKLSFFKLLLRDPRMPLLLKLLPLAAVAYIASPIDLLPGIVLDDLAVALLALVLIIKVAPRDVLNDLARRVTEDG